MFEFGFVAGFEGGEVGGEEDEDALTDVVVAEGIKAGAVLELTVPFVEAGGFPLKVSAKEFFIAAVDLPGNVVEEEVLVDGFVSPDVGLESVEDFGFGGISPLTL